MKVKALLSLFLIVVLFIAGCQKKEEPKAPENAPQTQTVTPPPVDTVKAVPEVKIPDLVGTWTGTFDSRATTLKITEQTETAFKGSITINYREVINQKVSGKLNLETKEVSMNDQLHSRFAGSYFGKLSEEGDKYSGTFTMKVDKSKFKFSLTKKK